MLFKSQYEYESAQRDSKDKYKVQMPRTIETDLQFKHKKPLITKCPNCKMTLVSSMKKCPNCGTKL